MYQNSTRMSLEELALFNELFSAKFGLFYPEHKREILENRLLPRLRASRVKRFSDYYLLLQYDLKSEQEALISAITNNETYFFRETAQLMALKEHALDDLRASSPVRGQVRILSAGCSSGEEPHTLNILARQGSFGRDDDWLRISGIDLDHERLAMARQAVYPRSSLRTLTDDNIHRYFEPHQEAFELRRIYRQGVYFAHGNLLDVETFRPTVSYDALFCRNVLIYFAEPALKQVIENFAEVIRPGGLLFLGHSESIIGLTKSFQAERLGQCIAYRRVAT